MMKPLTDAVTNIIAVVIITESVAVWGVQAGNEPYLSFESPLIGRGRGGGGRREGGGRGGGGSTT